MHIAIAGNIGAGKTTLTEMLSKHYGWEPHFEDVLKNPYLDDFYERMERWSFNLQNGHSTFLKVLPQEKDQRNFYKLALCKQNNI